MGEFVSNGSDDVQVGSDCSAYHPKNASKIDLCGEGRQGAALAKEPIPCGFIVLHEAFNSGVKLLLYPGGTNNRDAAIRLGLDFLDKGESLLDRFFGVAGHGSLTWASEKRSS